MTYRTFHDITKEPPFDAEAAWLSAGFIPIRSTDPPDLLALFPHYFSEEVVP